MKPPNPLREDILARRAAGNSFDDIAAALGTTRGTVSGVVYRDRVRAGLVEPQQSEWQPIETIPLDTPVLIYVPEIPIVMIDEMGADGEWQICDDDEVVTHWMPLPEAPS